MAPPDASRRRQRREGGVVLVLVIVFLLLLTSSVATFQRRAVLDSTIVRNRDATARAEALARGGVRLAVALLLEDRLREETGAGSVETRFDVWARAGELDLSLAEDAELRLAVDDAGALLNLNALFADGAPRDEGATQVLLEALLERALDGSELPPDRIALYDVPALARHLIDYVDADEVTQRGGFEDDYYQQQDPPYRAANRPLLSVDELALVEGFDPTLVDILRPYVSVYPYVAGEGINPNTAPPWVLGVLLHGVVNDWRLPDGQDVARMLRRREQAELICPEEVDGLACSATLEEILAGETYPPASASADVFRVRAAATTGGVTRTVEAWVDRSDLEEPRILSWRVE